MVLQRFIKFIASKAEEGSADHERELQNAADQFPEITDDVIGAYIEVSKPVEVEDWPILQTEYEAEAQPEPITVEIEEAMKWCSWHKRMEPVSAFTKNSTAKDGLQAYCIEGGHEYRASYDRKHPRRKPSVVNMTVRPFVPQSSSENDAGTNAIETESPEAKWCTAHRRMEPISNFNRDITKKDGYRTRCREYEHDREMLRRAQRRLERLYGNRNRPD